MTDCKHPGNYRGLRKPKHQYCAKHAHIFMEIDDFEFWTKKQKNTTFNQFEENARHATENGEMSGYYAYEMHPKKLKFST